MSVVEFRRSVRVLVFVVKMFPVPSIAVILLVYSASLWICDICLLCSLMLFLPRCPDIMWSVVSRRIFEIRSSLEP
jgi:hypothetical protein